MINTIKTPRLLFIILLLSFYCPLLLANTQNPVIEVFVKQGCPHCSEAESFLKKLHAEQPQLIISIHDIEQEPAALERLHLLAKQLNITNARVPAFYIENQLIIGYSDETSTGQWLRQALAKNPITAPPTASSGSCEITQSLSCEAPITNPPAEQFELNFFGNLLSLDTIGLPLFTLAMGLLDGFNPCSMWVLLLMISLLAPMGNRARMLAIAGTFVLVESIAYFIFMAAWLNLFLLIGLSKLSQIIIALIALIAGLINLKDFAFYGWGFSLSIPAKAKPSIYLRMRRLLQANSLTSAIIGSIVLAVLVQIVELLCTSGFPALFTRILTLRQLDNASYYGYLLLYNLAYSFDDIVVLAIGVITLSQNRLQEKQGRYLKLLSGLVMLGLGIYLLIA